jgi:Flp pilus assembly protein TadG
MNHLNHEEKQPPPDQRKRERGQAIVIIAAGIIVLLGFVGLAVDLGYLWVRDNQLSSAVDAAALAGAPELATGGLIGADRKATQFMNTNRIPDSAIGTFSSSRATSILGAQEYSITATWGVETYFARLFNIDTISVTHSATAAYFPLVDVYASRRVEAGALSVSTQGVFGPQICTSFGDAFSPLNSPWAPGIYSYRYRVYIPPDYESRNGTDIVRIEIFDPDSINSNPAQVLATHSTRWVNAGANRPATRAFDNPCGGTQHNACVLETTEMQLGCSTTQQADPNIFCEEDVDLINPYWFVRIDENRGAGGGNGNGTCGGADGPYRPQYNTQTIFSLSYFQRMPDGTLRNTPLASYTGQVGDGARDNGDHNTDLKWTTPGAFNDFGVVPTDCNSFSGGYLRSAGDTRCPLMPEHNMAKAVAGPGNGFDISLAEDTPRILTDATTGARFIYLDVTAVSGASENGFEVWAGPPSQSQNVPSDGNARNLYVSNNPGSRTGGGVLVYAMGILPMNSSGNARVQIPLVYIPAEYAGRTVSVSLFDPDSGTNPPVRFYFDTLSRQDYEVIYGQTSPDPAGRCFVPGGDCNNRWVGAPDGTGPPPFQIPVPDLTSECTNPGDANQRSVCTPFYGGRLYAEYQAGRHDTYAWMISLPSLPYLVR